MGTSLQIWSYWPCMHLVCLWMSNFEIFPGLLFYSVKVMRPVSLVPVVDGLLVFVLQSERAGIPFSTLWFHKYYKTIFYQIFSLWFISESISRSPWIKYAKMCAQSIRLVQMHCSYWNKATREAVGSDPWNCTSLPRGQKLEFSMQGWWWWSFKVKMNCCLTVFINLFPAFKVKYALPAHHQKER